MLDEFEKCWRKYHGQTTVNRGKAREWFIFGFKSCSKTRLYELQEKCFGIGGYLAQHNADKTEIKRLNDIVKKLVDESDLVHLSYIDLEEFISKKALTKEFTSSLDEKISPWI